MRNRIRRCLALISVVLCSTAAAKQEELTIEQALHMPLEELMTVALATGTPRLLAEAPAIATVVTADDIRAMGATDLDHVLESVPGLHVSRTHLAYKPALRHARPALRDQPLCAVPDQRPTDDQWASGNIGEFWGGLPVEAISRVEVIRGPGSALFGADAVGGVVNIVTRTAADVGGLEVGLRAGSFDTAEGWLLFYGGEHGGLDVSLGLQLRTTEGQREIVEADAHLDLGHGAWRLRLVRLGFQERIDLGTGAGFIQALDPAGATDRRRHTADLSWRDELTPRWEFEIQTSYLRDRSVSDVFPRPAGVFYRGRIPTRRSPYRDRKHRESLAPRHRRHLPWARPAPGAAGGRLRRYRPRRHRLAEQRRRLRGSAARRLPRRLRRSRPDLRRSPEARHPLRLRSGRVADRRGLGA